MNAHTICSACGGHLPSDSNFCPFCGASAPKEQFCTACGAASPIEANFCMICGAPFHTAKSPLPPKKPANGRRVRAIVRSSILLAISIFLLVASFLPIVSIKISSISGQELDETITVRYSAIDLVTLTADAVIEKGDAALEKEYIAKEYKEIYGDIAKMDPENLSKSNVQKLERFVWLSIRLTLRSSAVSLSPSLVFATVTAVLYIAFAATLFGLSIKSFVFALLGREERGKSTYKLFLLAPFFILLTYFAAQGAPVSSIAGISVGMAWTLPALVLSSLAAVYFVIEPYIFREKGICLRHLISSSTCLLLSLIAFFLCFGPAFNVEATGKFDGSSTAQTADITLESEFFQEFEINKSTARQIDGAATAEAIKANANWLFLGSAQDFYDGTQYTNLSSVLVSTTFLWYTGNTWRIFSFAYYTAFFAALLFAFCAWRSLVSLYDRPAKFSLITFASVALAMLAAYLVIDLVFVSEINRAFTRYDMASTISLSLSAVPVILTLLGVLVFAASIVLPKKVKQPSAPVTCQLADDFNA